MSDPTLPPGMFPGQQQEQPTPPAQPRSGSSAGLGSGTAFQNTPNAEKYVLEADAMRRRQLRSALLHGSRRTWREQNKQWPAVVVGVIVVAVIIAGLIVARAVNKSVDNANKQEQQQKQQNAPTAPVTPGPRRSPTAPTTTASPH